MSVAESDPIDPDALRDALPGMLPDALPAYLRLVHLVHCIVAVATRLSKRLRRL